MKELFKDCKLTRDNLIELLKGAKQDEQGHWYVELPYNEKYQTGGQRVYFGMFYTVCDDFVKEYTDASYGDVNTEHYNRHFTRNDDTFDLYVAKDVIRATQKL